MNRKIVAVILCISLITVSVLVYQITIPKEEPIVEVEQQEDKIEKATVTNKNMVQEDNYSDYVVNVATVDKPLLEYGSKEIEDYIFNEVLPVLDGNYGSLNDYIEESTDAKMITKEEVLSNLEETSQLELIQLIKDSSEFVGHKFYIVDVDNDGLDDLVMTYLGGSMGNDLLHIFKGKEDDTFDFTSKYILDAWRTNLRFYKSFGSEMYMIRIDIGYNYFVRGRITVEKLVDDSLYRTIYQVSDIDYEKQIHTGYSSEWDQFVNEHIVELNQERVIELVTKDETCIEELCSINDITYHRNLFLPSSTGPKIHLQITPSEGNTLPESLLNKLTDIQHEDFVDGKSLLQLKVEEDDTGLIYHVLFYDRFGNMHAQAYRENSELELVYDISYLVVYKYFTDAY